MAKTGRAVAKLTEKAKRNAIRANHGSHLAVVTRSKSTYADKLVAYREHQRLIRGQDYVMKDGREVCWAANPVPRITTLSKDGKKIGATFRGDGLPEEKPKRALNNQERAKEDKRQPLAAEMRDGWTPRADDWKPFDPVELALAAV